MSGKAESLRSSRSANRVVPSIFLLGPLAISLCVPFFGPLLTILPPILAPRQGPRLWPGIRPRRALLIALAASGGFWVSTALAMTGLLNVPRFAWMLLPLCGPTDSLLGNVPALPALVAYSLGAFYSVKFGRPWVWVFGTWLGIVASAVASWALESSGYGWGC